MAFMQLEVVKGEFHQLDTRNEGIVSYPARYFDAAVVAREHDVDVDDVKTVKGWFARLSAPGYLDCTEWSGPYKTEEEARAEMTEMYGDDEEDGF